MNDDNANVNPDGLDDLVRTALQVERAPQQLARLEGFWQKQSRAHRRRRRTLCAAALAAERGFDLRSRCLLWPEQELTWESLDQPGSDPTAFSLAANDAIALVKRAVAGASDLGLDWRMDPVILKPAPQLVKLVRRSQELAAQMGPDSEEGD